MLDEFHELESTIKKVSLSDLGEKQARRDIVGGGEAARRVVERTNWEIIVARKVNCRKKEDDDEVDEWKGNTKISLLNVHGDKTLPAKIDLGEEGNP